MKRGSLAVVVVLAVSAGLALTAVVYLKQPVNAVRGTFTLFHSLVFRNKREEAAKLVADRVVYRGRPMARGEFMAAFESPKKKGPPDIAICPADPTHWRVLMANESTCFVEAGNGWRLHWIGEGVCVCTAPK